MPQKTLNDILVKDIMRTDKVIVVNPEMTAREASILFAEENITGAPVVNANNELIGVVSVTDIIKSEAILDLKGVLELVFYNSSEEIKQTVQQHLNQNYSELSVSDIMSLYPVTATPDSSLKHIAKIMMENKIRRVIITEDNKVAGLVTITDILKIVVAD